MSDLNLNFTVQQLNADFQVDPAPIATLSVQDPMVAQFYVEGTTGGTGTVTQVQGSGSGLGFSLGGNVTTAGNITLTVPSDTALRTSLNIGNVANANFNGNGSQVLAGNGSWVAQSTAAGTVTQVNTSGSGLGFSLSGGPITSTGTVSLTVPSDTALRTSLNIGNVANINLNGNGSQVLAGNGSWVAQTGGSGGTYSGTAATTLQQVTHTSEVYLAIPYQLPSPITTGMVFRIKYYGICSAASGASGDANIRIRCGSTGTISDQLISYTWPNPSITSNGLFSGQWTLVATSNNTLSAGFDGWNGSTVSPHTATAIGWTSSGNGVSITNPIYLGLSGIVTNHVPGALGNATFSIRQVVITREL